MAILSKEEHKRLRRELIDRFNKLIDSFESRELDSASEGAPRGKYWPKPERLCVTVVSTEELKLAVSDFRTILTRLHQLK